MKQERMCQSAYDISSEHILQPWGNGVRLVAPDDSGFSPNEDFSIQKIFKNSFNIYLIDLENKIKQINDQTSENCGFLSVNDALGRTVRDVASKSSGEKLIENDRKVFKSGRPEISDETFEGLTDNAYNCLALKFPWYDNDKIIGLFGCSIVLNKHSLANSLSQILKLGLPNLMASGTESGTEIENLSLSKRENQCLYLCKIGKSAREIAEILNLSKRTIEHYLENLKIKLNVLTKSELIEKAMTTTELHAVNLFAPIVYKRVTRKASVNDSV